MSCAAGEFLDHKAKQMEKVAKAAKKRTLWGTRRGLVAVVKLDGFWPKVC